MHNKWRGLRLRHFLLLNYTIYQHIIILYHGANIAEIFIFALATVNVVDSEKSAAEYANVGNLCLQNFGLTIASKTPNCNAFAR